jgi:dCTP deaminase
MNTTRGLLSYIELCELVDAGVMTNVLPEQINSASIDITLGPTALKEAKPTQGNSHTLRLAARDKPRFIGVNTAHGLLLEPGAFALAASAQIFNLPNDISCEFKLKSSGARTGLNHLLAGWCDAGWHGSVLTLEYHNVLRYHAIELREGDAIGQMVFFRHTPVPAERSYAARGRYNGDKHAQGVKP